MSLLNQKGMRLFSLLALVLVLGSWLACLCSPNDAQNNTELWLISDFELHHSTGACCQSLRVMGIQPTDGYMFSSIDYSPMNQVLVVVQTGIATPSPPSRLLFINPDSGAVASEVQIDAGRVYHSSINAASTDIAMIAIQGNDDNTLYIYSLATKELHELARGQFQDCSWDANSEVLYVSTSNRVNRLYQISVHSSHPQIAEIATGLAISGCRDAGAFFFADMRGNLFLQNSKQNQKLLFKKVDVLDPRYFSYMKYLKGSDNELAVASFRIKSNELNVLNTSDGKTTRLHDDCGFKDYVAWRRLNKGRTAQIQ